MGVTSRTQMALFTTCCWLPFHVQAYKEVQHKCSNNKMLLLHSFHQPQLYPSTLFYYFRFQRISSNLILPISGKNSLLPQTSVVCQGSQSHGKNMIYFPGTSILHYNLVCWEMMEISTLFEGSVTPVSKQSAESYFVLDPTSWQDQ